jgi:hypothetical protein
VAAGAEDDANGISWALLTSQQWPLLRDRRSIPGKRWSLRRPVRVVAQILLEWFVT